MLVLSVSKPKNSKINFPPIQFLNFVEIFLTLKDLHEADTVLGRISFAGVAQHKYRDLVYTLNQ